MKKPQTLSLQEQLLKSGLASDAKAKQIKAEKRKQTKVQRNQGIETLDTLKLDLELSRLQQAERDRELNLLHKKAEEQKALAAQLKQIIELNRIEQDPNGISYQFNDQNKVKTIYVTDKVRADLIEGRTGIVKVNDIYELIPADTARKIQARDPNCYVLLNDKTVLAPATDDPYASYQIPDDLIW